MENPRAKIFGGTAMLVLSRRVGERIEIDGDISITVVSIKGFQVRLGITAPKKVRVDREEIHLRRKKERARAAVENSASP